MLAIPPQRYVSIRACPGAEGISFRGLGRALRAAGRHHAVAHDDVDEQHEEHVEEQDEEDDDEHVEPNAISAKST